MLKICLGFLLVVSSIAHSELQTLDDQAMANVQGAGLGLVLEDFVFDVDNAVTTLTGIENSKGESITVDWTELYIMGAGSNNGSNQVVGQVGSLAHPITLRSLDYTSVPSAPDNVAILELAGPNYTGDVLNDTSKYGLWSLYQGCLWGAAGCNNANDANTNISAEISGLTTEQSQLESKYTSFTTLKSSIDSDLVNVSNKEAALASEVADVGPARTTMTNRWNAAGQPGTLGQEKDCGLFGWDCDSADNSYNSSVVTYTAENKQVLDAQRAVGEAWQVTSNGVKLVDRLLDFERYERLCGGNVAGNDRSCTSGLIVAKSNDRADILVVINGLNSGGSRRSGLDVGSKFAFQVFDSSTNAYRTDFLDLDLTGVTADGSYLRLWSEAGELDGELNIQLFADTFNISTCGISNCGTQAQRNASTIFGQNVYVNLALGYGKAQPLSFSVTSDGQFEIELPKITYQDVQDGFYQNAPKSNIYVGNLNLGGNVDLGSMQVKGLSTNYLRVRSHDL